MKREEQIKAASSAYTRVKCPMAIGGDRFKNMIDSLNANPAFIAGAEWADKNPKSPWISVEERLPEITVPILRESDFVFVHVVNKDTGHEWVELPAKYNKQFHDWMTNDFTWINKRGGVVTHWMPIPQIPKEIEP